MKKELPSLIAVVGMCGSGKSVACSLLVDMGGYEEVYFGGFTMDELARRSLERTPENEQLVRNALRRRLGKSAYAKIGLPKITALLQQGDAVIINGLYSWSEYLVLKKAFPEIMVIAVWASPETRYRRLMNRPDRPLTLEQAVARDHDEIKRAEKGGPIAMADLTLDNDRDDFRHLAKQITKFLLDKP